MALKNAELYADIRFEEKKQHKQSQLRCYWQKSDGQFEFLNF